MTHQEKFAQLEAKMWAIVKQCPLPDMLLEASCVANRLEISTAQARDVARRVHQRWREEEKAAEART